MTISVLFAELLCAVCLHGALVAAPRPWRERVTALDPSGTAFEVALYGGETDAAGHLRGAGVAICDATGEVVWDGFDAGLHPWLLRAGRFGGRDVLLVGVRKVTVFDPVERARPFVYALGPEGHGLARVWLGSSLSRPFVTADFGNLDERGEDELVALERTSSGGLSLGVYRWRGFGVEGIARSEELPGARDLACGDVWGDAADEVVVVSVDGGVWQFTAFSLDERSLVSVAQVRVTVGKEPARWELVGRARDRPGAVRLVRKAITRTIRFRQRAEESEAP